MTMVDSNVVIDLIERDPIWYDWSLDMLSCALHAGPVSVSAIVVGELTQRIDSMAEICAMLDGYELAIAPLDHQAAHAAGAAHRAYRLAGGTREKMLADFLIGGHAQSAGATLLTRDARRYRSYFPDLKLITPEKNAHD